MSNIRTYFIRLKNTVCSLVGVSELLLGKAGCEQRIQCLVQHFVYGSSCALALICVQVLSYDTFLVLTLVTELFNLEACVLFVAKYSGQSLTSLVVRNGLVELDNVCTTTREINTLVETASEEANYGSKDKYTRNDVRNLTAIDEVDFGVR